MTSAWRQAFGELRRRAMTERGRGVQLMLVGLVVATAMFLTPLGDAANDHLFYRPTMRLRAALDLLPRLDEAIRLILFEDRSLERLGRPPTSAEWIGIARQLEAAGYESIVLLGTHDQDAVAATTEALQRAKFAVGVVVVDAATNSRTVPINGIPAEKLTTTDGGQEYRQLKRVIAPSRDLIATADRLGHVNLTTSFEMPVAYVVDATHLVPNIGLLGPRGGNLGPEPRLPRSVGGRGILVNYVSRTSATLQSLPAGGFFDDNGSLRKAVSPKFAARLAGGRVAFLVPDAITGSRFIEGPEGDVPSYLAVASVANSALTGNFITPVPYSGAMGIAVCCLWWLVLQARRRPRLVWLGILAAVAPPALAVALLLGLDVVFPTVSMTTTLGVMLGFLAFWRHQDSIRSVAANEKEMEIGRSVQAALLPVEQRYVCGDWEFQVFYRPYFAMAGDWYQNMSLVRKDGSVLAVSLIGDGVGKGPSAALLTAAIATVWNSYLERHTEDFSVGAFLGELDRTLRRTFRGEQFTTMSIAVVDQAGIHVLACGTAPWIHVQFASGVAKTVRTPKLPLVGMNFGDEVALPEARPTLVEVAPGDILIAYTDGVMESVSAKAFRDAVVGLRADDADLFAKVEALARSTGAKLVLPDDSTFLVIRRLPAAVLASAA